MKAAKAEPILKIDKNFEVPSVPIVLSRILQMVDDESLGSARMLEELILHDPSLSARILKLANSAFYSFRSEVRTISHAIALLGLNLVKSLAIGVSIFESFTRGLRDESGFINGLWMHSFAAGLISQDIWARRRNRTEGEFAFLCGLLHDLGKVVFFKKDAAGYSSIFAVEKSGSEDDLSSMEYERYGINHASLGSTLAKQWGLPSSLATVLRQHHDPLNSTEQLAAAVSLADHLVRQAGIGEDGDCRSDRLVPELRARLEMDDEEYDLLCLLTVNQRKEVEGFFELVS